MRIVFAALAAVILAAPAMAQDGRTFVDRLPLDTPQGAATAFLDAFNAEDYAAAYYMLSPEAKQTFVDSYYTYTAGRYFTVGEGAFIEGSLMSEADIADEEIAEVGSDTALIFDNLVFHAHENGEMPFDLTDAKVASVEETGDENKAVVIVEGGKPSPIRIEAVHLYNGDWRIDRIHWAGSDAALKPWGPGHGKVKNR
ncbi:hypothetical protein VW35_03170 [Devosia soli]|uniref:SnoaL-like domain-containing protein n=1 Tax=Devosia soli TaxID=361041 RepID=A0A0F5LFU3_9HYPH|nr:hypothetical protein [Devosia soli]KKB81165.1 hypothetical protein VW35_03170 [Devosia soli]